MSGAPRSRPPASLDAETASNGHLFTAEQLAERWALTPAAVYRLTRRGAIPTVRLGRYYRYRIDAIEAFEERGGCLPAEWESVRTPWSGMASTALARPR